MEVSARLKGARLSAQNARLVADQIRGQQVGEALNILNFSTKKEKYTKSMGNQFYVSTVSISAKTLF